MICIVFGSIALKDIHGILSNIADLVCRALVKRLLGARIKRNTNQKQMVVVSDIICTKESLPRKEAMQWTTDQAGADNISQF